MSTHLLTLVALVAAATTASAGINLVPNGDFARWENEPTRAAGWHPQGYAGSNAPGNVLERVGDEQSGYLRIVSGEPNKNHYLAKTTEHIQLSPDWKELEVSLTYRLPSLVPGPENWNNFRVQLAFLNDLGDTLDTTSVLASKAAFTSWETRTATVKVPNGATSFYAELVFLGANGEAHVRELRIQPADMP